MSETGGDIWRITERGRKRRVTPPLCEVDFPPLCGVECSNKFGLLATQEEEEIVIEIGAGEGDRTPKAKIVRRKLDGKERKEGGKARKDRERLEGSQEVLVLGDSRIKYLDETFCEADRARRMTCCLPGGRSAGRGREI